MWNYVAERQMVCCQKGGKVMQEHQENAKGALVKLLHRRTHFSAFDWGLQEKKVVNEELMSNVPALLSFSQ
jgi:hypothetical protein